MRKYLVTVVLLMVAYACKNDKSNSEKKADNVNKSAKTASANDLINAYNPLKLPFSVTDTSLSELSKTDTIGYALFSQFVPDTVFTNPFGKNRKVSIFPIGKIEQKGKESYLATFVKDKNHSAVYLLVFDKKGFTTSMPLVINNEDKIVSTAAIDKKLAIVINNEWKVKNDIF